MRQSEDLRLEPQPWNCFLQNTSKLKGTEKGRSSSFTGFDACRQTPSNGTLGFGLGGFFQKAGGIATLARSPRVSFRKAWPILRHPNRTFAVAFAWLERAPSRILFPITVTLLLGWILFSRAAACGALAPTESEAYRAFTTGKPMPAAYPVLNPFVYTLENAVPLVKLGLDEKWAPDQRHTAATVLTKYWVLMWARWLLILSGWFQATVLAAALLRRFKEQ